MTIMMTGNLLARTGSASAVHAPSYNGQGYDRTTNQLRTVNRRTLCRRARLVGRISAASLAAEVVATHDEVSGPVTCKACLKHIDKAHAEALDMHWMRCAAIDAQHEMALEENARRDNPCGWLVSLSGRLHIPAANGATPNVLCGAGLDPTRKPITGYWCVDCVEIRDEIHERALIQHTRWVKADEERCGSRRPGTGHRCVLIAEYTHRQHNDEHGRTWTDDMTVRPDHSEPPMEGFHAPSAVSVLRGAMADEVAALPRIPAAGGRHYLDAPGFRQYGGVWFVVAAADRVPVGGVVRIWQRTDDVWRQVRITKHVAEYRNNRGRRFVLCEFENAHDTEHEWRRSGGVPE